MCVVCVSCVYRVYVVDHLWCPCSCRDAAVNSAGEAMMACIYEVVDLMNLTEAPSDDLLGDARAACEDYAKSEFQQAGGAAGGFQQALRSAGASARVCGVWSVECLCTYSA